MKKVLLSIAAAVVCAISVNAQDLAKLTELYNNGAAALGNGEKKEALNSFKEVLNGAKALGDEGKELVANCQNIIPSIILSLAKDSYKDGNVDQAIELAKESVSVAKEYGNADVESEATALVGQLAGAKASSLLAAKDYAGAAAAYEELVAADASNGKYYLYLGMAYAGLGDTQKAIKAYESASANGEQDKANSQLSKLFLKDAAAALKVKNYVKALSSSLKSAEYQPSANAYKIAGNASAQLQKYSDAVKYFTKYLELNPNAADAAQVKANIEAFKKL